MGRIASIEDFEQGGLYTSYTRYPFFKERATNLKGRITTGKVLIVGCGWGYLVDELVKLGIDAWGIEISQYAVDKAQTVIPDNAYRIIKGDASIVADMDRVKTASGLNKNQKFYLVVSEDMFTVCLDDEVTLTLNQMHRIGSHYLHIMTCIHPEIPGDIESRFASINWKTQSQWKTLLGSDPCWDTEQGVQF